MEGYREGTKRSIESEMCMVNNKARNQEIVTLKNCGKSYSQIGIQFGLSKERIRQICEKEKKRIILENIHINALNGTTPYLFYDAILEACSTESQATRLFRCLKRSGIIDEIEKNNGSLDSYSDETLLNIRNFGLKSLHFARKANVIYKKKQKTKDIIFE